MSRPPAPLPAVAQHVKVRYEGREYRSNVLDAEPPHYKVAYPFPAAVRPMVGDEAELLYLVGSLLGTLPVRIVGRAADPVLMLLLEQEGEPAFTVRRTAFRLDVGVPAELVVRERRHLGMTVDVSAGGACLRFGGEAPIVLPGEPCEVLLQLDAERSFHAQGQIVRTEVVAGQPAVAVRFVDPRPGDQDRLVRWLFDQQRERRRRGLA
jgi:c-di-GMP-binding flagellar brake protein YcgR